MKKAYQLKKDTPTLKKGTRLVYHHDKDLYGPEGEGWRDSGVRDVRHFEGYPRDIVEHNPEWFSEENPPYEVKVYNHLPLESDGESGYYYMLFVNRCVPKDKLVDIKRAVERLLNAPKLTTEWDQSTSLID